MLNDFKNFVANNYAIVRYIQLHFAFGICTTVGICGRDIIDYCVLKIKSCYTQIKKLVKDSQTYLNNNLK